MAAIASAIALLFAMRSVLAAASVQVTSFTIDDVPNQAVFHDAGNSADGFSYRDYRLTDGAVADPNYCVEASPSNTGTLFARLNRKLDGDAGSMYCGLFSAGVPRQFTIHVTDLSACNELAVSGYAAIDDVDGSCDVTGQDKPRIRLSNLYARKPVSTPVAFLVEQYSNSVSFDVETDRDAPITLVSANVRYVRYAASAHVVKYQGGATQPVPVGSSFPLPFQMTFTTTTLR